MKYLEQCLIHFRLAFIFVFLVFPTFRAKLLSHFAPSIISLCYNNSPYLDFSAEQTEAQHGERELLKAPLVANHTNQLKLA